MSNNGVKYVRHIKSDGTLDKKIKLIQSENDDLSDLSFMASRNIHEYFPRHAWNIAIETQKILREELGRKIVCDIL